MPSLSQQQFTNASAEMYGETIIYTNMKTFIL